MDDALFVQINESRNQLCNPKPDHILAQVPSTFQMN